MIELLTTLMIFYVIGIIITFIVLIFFKGFNSSSFAEIGLIISVALSVVWPLMVTMYITEAIKQRKNK